MSAPCANQLPPADPSGQRATELSDVADRLGEVLADAGLALPGDRGHLRGDPDRRLWIVVGTVAQYLAGVNCAFSYRLQSGVGSRVVDAMCATELFERTAGPDEPFDDGPPDTELDPLAAVARACCEGRAPGRINWAPSAPTRSESTDGRFVVGRAGGGFTAADLWTGTESAHPDRAAAVRWCEDRRAGEYVTWFDGGGNPYGRGRDGAVFNLYVLPGGKHYATDARLVKGHEGYASPLFGTRDGAKAWCAVRAACAVVGVGGGATVEYVGAIPF